MSWCDVSLLRDAAQRPAGWLARAGRLGRGFGGIFGIRGMGDCSGQWSVGGGAESQAREEGARETAGEGRAKASSPLNPGTRFCWQPQIWIVHCGQFQGNRILLGENLQQIVSFPTGSLPLTIWMQLPWGHPPAQRRPQKSSPPATFVHWPRLPSQTHSDIPPNHDALPSPPSPPLIAAAL